MKLIRSGSTIFAVSPQQSGSLVYPGYTKNGRLLELADSHLSGNTVFNIVTNNEDGAEWTQVGDSIQVATSASGDSQFTTNLRNCISYRFWDTGVKVKDDPCCTMEFVTHDQMKPYGNYSGTGVYHAIGFVTAPAGGIANIDLGDNAGANYGTSWSSVRWVGLRWNSDNNKALEFCHRQGDVTWSGFSSDLDPDDTGTVNYHFQIKMSEILFNWLDGTFEWLAGFSVVNYPGNDGDGDYTSLKTILTDTPVGQNGDLGDHHIYAFTAVGRRGAGGDVQTILGKYKVWVQ